jgi:hypothetical protein
MFSGRFRTYASRIHPSCRIDREARASATSIVKCVHLRQSSGIDNIGIANHEPRNRSLGIGHIGHKIRASMSIMPRRSRIVSVGIDHWASATSIVKCVDPCQSCRIVRNESVGNIDRKMRASKSIIPHRSRIVSVGIDHWARPYRS